MKEKKPQKIGPNKAWKISYKELTKKLEDRRIGGIILGEGVGRKWGTIASESLASLKAQREYTLSPLRFNPAKKTTPEECPKEKQRTSPKGNTLRMYRERRTLGTWILHSGLCKRKL
uniref:Uncharacterized protein n=1 Tax=Morchella brunnea TaxID=1174671 RepID=A0A8K1MH78_9PEZI|nr:hypothetical protein LK370_mgp190 [Morchella brunnea]UBU98370.1 hypothetical protein [Morchella brunnea]